jgi:hypothetical protein
MASILHFHLLHLVMAVGFLFVFHIEFNFPCLLILDLGGGETSTDGAFGSFFFGNGGSPVNKEQTPDGKTN